MTSPYGFEKTTTKVFDLKGDDRLYVGGTMFKIQSDPITSRMGETEIHMFPVFVDFLADVITLTLPSHYLFEIYNQ